MAAPVRSAILCTHEVSFHGATALEERIHEQLKLETLFHMQSYPDQRSTTYPRDDERPLRLGLAGANKNTFPPLPLEALMCFVKKMRMRLRGFCGNKLHDAIAALIMLNLEILLSSVTPVTPFSLDHLRSHRFSMLFVNGVATIRSHFLLLKTLTRTVSSYFRDRAAVSPTSQSPPCPLLYASCSWSVSHA